jgi:hypothetical protein
MADVSDLLPEPRQIELMNEFDDALMNAALVRVLELAYTPSKTMLVAISDTFVGSLPGGGAMPLAPLDRERTIVALLAARGEKLNLAIHIYCAVALGVTPKDIVHTLLLTGVYAGIPAFSNSIAVAAETFQFLADLTGPLTPDKVLEAFLNSFP